MTQWISINDKLPDDGETVIVCVPESCDPVCVAFMEADAWIDVVGEAVIDFPVSHWMPLPEPPKGV